MDETLDIAPFPPLRWDTYSWAGTVTLPSWAGFQARGGAYGSRSSKKPSDGTARLHVAVEDHKAQTPPTAAQISAMQHLLDNEAAVASAVLRAIFEMYPEEKAKYEDAYDEEDGATLPKISDPSELRTLMRLSTVHVLYVTKGDTAYMGFEFRCAWEAEHGAGVMTHLGRIVEVGPADCSFLEWIAEADAGGSTEDE